MTATVTDSNPELSTEAPEKTSPTIVDKNPDTPNFERSVKVSDQNPEIKTLTFDDGQKIQALTSFVADKLEASLNRSLASTSKGGILPSQVSVDGKTFTDVKIQPSSWAQGRWTLTARSIEE